MLTLLGLVHRENGGRVGMPFRLAQEPPMESRRPDQGITALEDIPSADPLSSRPCWHILVNHAHVSTLQTGLLALQFSNKVLRGG